MPKSTSETPAQANRREHKRQMRRLKDNRKITKFRSNATIGKIFPRASFVRVVREVLQDIEDLNEKTESYLLSHRASAALQTAAESYLDGLFDDCDEILRHTGTETLNCGTIQLVQRLRGKNRAAQLNGTTEPEYVMVPHMTVETTQSTSA